MKKSLKIILIIIAIVLIIVGAGALYYSTCMNPKRGTVKNLENSAALEETFTGGQALEDLDYVYQHVCKRHPAWLDGNNELVAKVEAQYETEKAYLEGKDEVTELEIWQACARMTSVMHDGHTGVFYVAKEPRYINDVAQVNEYGMPTMIDGIAFETIEKNFLSTYSYEREEYAKSGFYRSAVDCEQYLAVSGVDTSDGVVFTFDTPDGVQEYSYSFVPWDEVKGLPEEATEDTPWVSYSIDEEAGIATFTLLECNDTEEYRETVDQFFTEVFDNGIQNIIVDLRGNGGGNSGVADYFLGYLDVDEIQGWDFAMRLGGILYKHNSYVIENPEKDREFDGDLYVLTDIHTFSSGMDFAMLIADNHLGTLIGEASGNMPTGYGDTLTFQTPNAKLGMIVSYKRWWRVDQSKAEEPLLPDVETTGEEALDKAYEIITGVSTEAQPIRTYTPEELLDQFLADETPAYWNNEGGESFMFCDLETDEEEWLSYSVDKKTDLDNDGEPELVLNGPYGGMYLDTRNQKVYVFESGKGTAENMSYTNYEDAVWIVHEDTSHMGREIYWLKKYEGGDKVVDEFQLSAEYWDAEVDEYDETSDFTYRDEKITMQEFEKLKKEIFK